MGTHTVNIYQTGQDAAIGTVTINDTNNDGIVQADEVGAVSWNSGSAPSNLNGVYVNSPNGSLNFQSFRNSGSAGIRLFGSPPSAGDGGGDETEHDLNWTINGQRFSTSAEYNDSNKRARIQAAVRTAMQPTYGTDTSQDATSFTVEGENFTVGQIFGRTGNGGGSNNHAVSVSGGTGTDPAVPNYTGSEDLNSSRLGTHVEANTTAEQRRNRSFTANGVTVRYDAAGARRRSSRGSGRTNGAGGNGQTNGTNGATNGGDGDTPTRATVRIKVGDDYYAVDYAPDGGTADNVISDREAHLIWQGLERQGVIPSGGQRLQNFLGGVVQLPGRGGRWSNLEENGHGVRAGQLKSRALAYRDANPDAVSDPNDPDNPDSNTSLANSQVRADATRHAAEARRELAQQLRNVLAAIRNIMSRSNFDFQDLITIMRLYSKAASITQQISNTHITEEMKDMLSELQSINTEIGELSSDDDNYAARIRELSNRREDSQRNLQEITSHIRQSKATVDEFFNNLSSIQTVEGRQQRQYSSWSS